MNERDFVNEHFAQYPIIFVNFKDSRGSSSEAIKNSIKVVISRAFEEHEYMIRVFSQMIANGDKVEKIRAHNKLKLFRKYYEDKGINKSDLDIGDSLRFLSEILYEHFGKKVYVLIDEYDTPLQESPWNNNIDIEDINEYYDSILCSALKDNKYLEKAVMTGISEIVRASAYSSLTNYVFTEDEVDQLLDDFSIEINQIQLSTEKSDVKKWYDIYMLKDRNLNLAL
jgi:hypothetical protein